MKESATGAGRVRAVRYSLRAREGGGRLNLPEIRRIKKGNGKGEMGTGMRKKGLRRKKEGRRNEFREGKEREKRVMRREEGRDEWGGVEKGIVREKKDIPKPRCK